MIPPYDGQAVNTRVNIESGNSQHFQLYNLKSDLGQQKNLAFDNPEKLKEMVDAFESIRGKDFSSFQELKLK